MFHGWNLRNFAIASFFVTTTVFGAAKMEDVDAALSKGQFNEAAEIAHEILAREPKRSEARLKGAFALFQKGYGNAALSLLRGISADDWKRLPQGQDRLVEILSLYQKKVPLSLLPARIDQINASEISPYLQNEIRFAKGRAAAEAGQMALAQQHLQSVTPNSRYFGLAHYVLGTIAIRNSDYKTASMEFSKVLEPTVFDQSSELWKDVGSQQTSQYNISFKVNLSTESIAQSSRVAELAHLALARIAYAQKNYEDALVRYSKISPTSEFYPRVRLERVWATLGLGKHDDAQKLAADLFAEANTFEAVEARPLRALILADTGRTEDARKEIEAFFKVYESYKSSSSRPSFVFHDLKIDERLKVLASYQEALRTESDALAKEDARFFPVYSHLRQELVGLLSQSQNLVDKLTREHIERRGRDLEKLYVQARLINAETWLEDREKLRAQFKGMKDATLEQQHQHDETLVRLLDKATSEIEIIRSRNMYPLIGKANAARMEFRSAELLWELSSARGILAQSSQTKKNEELAEENRRKSLSVAEKIQGDPNALFFTGFAQMELGKQSEGLKTLERYLAQYPNDGHADDALRIIADAKFDANQFPAAEQLYSKILQIQNTAIAGYAYYKLGWCAYNRKDFARALLALEKAVLTAQTVSDQSQVLSLKREAKHDLVSLYAEVGDAKKAFEYFGRFNTAETQSWVAELAAELDRTGQFEKAVELYRQLLFSYASDAEAINWQAAIVNGAYKLRRWQQVVEGARELTEKFGSILKDPKRGEEAEKILRGAMFEQQFELKKEFTEESAKRVLELDEIYLSMFGELPISQDPLYRHAHFLLGRKKHDLAVAAFRKHWNQHKTLLKEPLREEAIRNLIHALEKLENEGKVEVRPELLALAVEYQAGYPATKYSRSIQYLQSALLYKNNEFEAAVKQSQQLYDADPSDDISKRAFNNMRVALYEKKDWKRIFEWSSRNGASVNPAARAYLNDLNTIREESLFMLASQATELEKSADLFLKIAADPKMSRNRDKALFNAFVNLDKAGKKIEALKIADELETVFPKYAGLNDISGVRAAYYQDIGDYQRALPLLEAFLDRPGKDIPNAEVIPQAHLNAGLIAEGVGKLDWALAHFRKAPPDSQEAKRGIERIERRAALARSPSAVASAPPPFAPWAGLVKERQQFEKDPVPAKGELAARIQTGAARLEKLIKTIGDIASAKGTPDHYAYESFCIQPFLYIAYAKGVRGVAETSGFKPEEVVELKKEIEKIALPLDAKTVELAKDCIAKSEAAEHDGENYRKILEVWGGLKEKAFKSKFSETLAWLKGAAPFVDSIALPEGIEKKIFETHLAKKEEEETWYMLAKSRWDGGKAGLARLTTVDAIGKKFNSGRVLNLYSVADLNLHPPKDPREITARYEQAATAGSKAAWANLALHHMKGARIKPSLHALREALDGGVFDAQKDLKPTVEELLKLEPKES